MSSYLYDIETKERYNLLEVRWQSDKGNLLDISHDSFFDPEVLHLRPPNMWRYREAFAIDKEINIVSLGEAITPLVSIPIAGKSVQLKVDYLFPSGSYKDRGAAVLMSHASYLGVHQVVQDSSGNAGCAIAQYSQRAGIECDIYVPSDTSLDKLVQMEVCGAKIHLIEGSREDTARAAEKQAKEYYYASHVWNPFFLEGMKSFAYELWEQSKDVLPNTIILPAGNGTLLLGTYAGLKDLLRHGCITRMPKLVGVQAANCAPLYSSFIQSRPHDQELPGNKRISVSNTIAEGIAIAQPKRGQQMLRAVEETGGQFLAVEEEEIIAAWSYMAQLGFYIEPTSAAVIAGVTQYMLHSAERDEQVTSVLTGHGLKASQKMAKLITP